MCVKLVSLSSKVKIMKRLLLNLLLIFCLLPAPLLAQDDEDPCVQTMDKASEKRFKTARDLQRSGKKSEAFEIYHEILEDHPEYLSVNYYLGLGYYLPFEMNGFYIDKKSTNNALEAINAFKRINEVCPYYQIHHNLYGARLAYKLEHFSDAIAFAKIIIENPDDVKKMEHIDEAEIIIKRSKFFDNVLNNPVPFDPKPVPGITTGNDEYLATISPDGEYFYFTRRKEVEKRDIFGSTSEEKELFTCSKRTSQGYYSLGEPLPHPFNHSTNEGSPTISLNNDLLVFARMSVTKVNGQDYPNYDLYYSQWYDGEWSAPQSLGANVNRSDSWESQPSLSSDGRVLFFASDRPGGYGGSDIWFCERNSDGSWRKPVNLGPTINTKANERSPFLHTDSRTLYFSSSGHPGLGGMDVFYSKLKSDNTWQTPVNIGYPINSENDEVDFFVSLDGRTAYFSSNNIDNKDWNIYQFELYEKARPQNMVIIKGEVTSEDGDFSNTTVEIRDTASQVVATAQVNEFTGQYAIATHVDTEKPQDIILNVKKAGYAYDTKLVTVKQIENNVAVSNAEIKKVEVGKTYQLNDIYYATNSYELTDQSKYLINLFVEFLKENPTVKVEIQGHTDDVGNDQANMILSQNRARSVYEYAISKNVDVNRLRYKGYGETRPIATNSTEEGRAKNRRTVFLIYEQ